MEPASITNPVSLTLTHRAMCMLVESLSSDSKEPWFCMSITGADRAALTASAEDMCSVLERAGGLDRILSNTHDVTLREDVFKAANALHTAIYALDSMDREVEGLADIVHTNVTLEVAVSGVLGLARQAKTLLPRVEKVVAAISDGPAEISRVGKPRSGRSRSARG